jgi:hypothetical protein
VSRGYETIPENPVTNWAKMNLRRTLAVFSSANKNFFPES